ncbi:prolyl aminopeptidase [Actinoplanes sp. G11-F43]|uniref:prolyl aminopeptidase n=1 Tax=Actinoplanes sp. G11-F43 TaxID=3424130 RepID=UPI003D325E3A
MATVYLLTGLTGSGKTTYATRVLEPAGAVRLSVDERVFARHGRYGVDYPEHTYGERAAPVVAEVRAEMVTLLTAGRDVIVDHGLWLRADRDHWRALAEEAGAEVRLLYFPVPRNELLRRLAARNRESHANALTVTPEALDAFQRRFDPPSGEGEQIIAADGHLDVGDGHRVHWESWGNPAGVPVILLHGGPGAGYGDSHKALFDPARHHVLFHDQRGCGRSTPFAETGHNTTGHLIADIEALRRHLGWESAHLAGGSWGATLALLYAMRHPGRVRGLTLWSVYLARRADDAWAMGGPPRHFLPAEWDRFTGPVPADLRDDPEAVMAHYHRGLRDEDAAVARRHAVEWALWEAALTSLDYDPVRNERLATGDPTTVPIARLETHYFTNGCFIPENHILDAVGAVRHIPATLVHGRFDMCTPPAGAYELRQAYGENLALRWVNSGHLRTDPEMFAALRAATAALR